ncbi:MAG: hypothetical protein JW731_05135 [Bacteroidales bacterium]|nr:hypothetical protein [Bacteroidales bacterium]
MGLLMKAYDCSIDGKVELYLFWMQGGQSVDVAIYIHNIPGGKKAILNELKMPKLIQEDIDYIYAYDEVNGTIPFSHTEYFAYTIPEAPPKEVLAEYTVPPPPPGGTVSQARTEAL